LGELAKKHGYELIPAVKALGVTLGLVTEYKIVKFTASEKHNQLTEQARMSYHRGASLLLAEGLSCQQNHASQGGFFSSIIEILHFETVFGHVCIHIKYFHFPQSDAKIGPGCGGHRR
jgi:hypothetical protein